MFKIPFLDNTEMNIIFMDFEPDHDTTFLEEADQALTNFLKLNSVDKISISDLACKNCMDFYSH